MHLSLHDDMRANMEKKSLNLAENILINRHCQYTQLKSES